MPLQLDDKRLLIFGGINKRERYNDVWVLDIEGKSWSKVRRGRGSSLRPTANRACTQEAMGRLGSGGGFALMQRHQLLSIAHSWKRSKRRRQGGS